MQKEYRYILADQNDRIVTITLNRPEVQNAFHPDMLIELTTILDELKKSDVEILILKGNGRSFCAGADINWFKSLNRSKKENIRKQLTTFSEMLLALYNFPSVTIAVVHGYVMGGGIGLTSACDFVLGSEDCRFAFREVKIGLSPAIISPFVIRKTGVQKATELMLTGDFFNGTIAKESGLLSHLISSKAMDNTLNNLTNELLSGGNEAKKQIKVLLKEMNPGRITEEKLNNAINILQNSLKSNEAKEGFNAFLEKRKPAWN